MSSHFKKDFLAQHFFSNCFGFFAFHFDANNNEQRWKVCASVLLCSKCQQSQLIQEKRTRLCILLTLKMCQKNKIVFKYHENALIKNKLVMVKMLNKLT